MSNCQEYDGTIATTGYGVVRVGKKMFLAHRVSWALYNGQDPSGMVVRHICDNRPCVNPEHLTIGTQLDNVRDMYERNHNVRGSKRGQAKLTEADIPTIRSLLDAGIYQRVIAERFGVSRSTVQQIKLKNVWLHVT